MKIITTILLMLAMPSFAQKILKPELSSENNFTVAQQLKWETLIAKGEDQDLEKDPENFDSYNGPYTFEPGCSWYCGGEMYKVTSDAYLPANGKADYKPDNLHDFNLLTAWVPKGSIGKKINFHFKPLSPRVNKIIIYNGYIKNYDLFKSNSRVKEFKLYLNGKFYATLELADTTAAQSFSIEAVRSNDKDQDLMLTLEIASIYKGDKYADVAVSEINFDGIDVH